MSRWRDESKDSLDFPACPRSVEAPSFLQGELPAPERARFAAHLRDCPDCLREVHEAGVVLSLLRALPAGAGGGDLLPGILSRIEGEEQPAELRGLRRRRPVAVGVLVSSSVLALVAGGALVAGLRAPWSAWASSHSGGSAFPPRPPRGGGSAFPSRPPEGGGSAFSPRGGAREAALERGLGWLLEAQEPSGGWSAARWGGQPAYNVGLSGLAVLALLNAPRGDHAAGEARPSRTALAQALAFLRESQSSDGRFGPHFPGALYNHSITTVALLEAFARERDGSQRETLDRAVRFLCRSQSPDGGWGYLDCAEPPNTAMTCWPLQGLVLARALGFPGLDAAIR